MTVVAWGQYVHWAHLQFERFTSMSDDTDGSHLTGVVAHWLAAEYVVLEGWRELGFRDKRISRLIEIYPENCEALRRCRNAVYHFQSKILDERIVKCAVNQNEELLWSVALHSEFQRFLITYPYLHQGTFEEQAELANEIELCVGWAPHQTPSAATLRIVRKCIQFEKMLAESESAAAGEGKNLITTTLEQLATFDDAPYLSKLTRWSSIDKKQRAPREDGA